MATVLATQKLPRLAPRREWRTKRATPCQAKAVAIFAWGRELLATAWVHRGSVQLANTTIYSSPKMVQVHIHSAVEVEAEGGTTLTLLSAALSAVAVPIEEAER